MAKSRNRKEHKEKLAKRQKEKRQRLSTNRKEMVQAGLFGMFMASLENERKELP